MKTRTLIKVDGYSGAYVCELFKAKYTIAQTLALGLLDIEDKEIYGIFTVSIEGVEPEDEYCAFVDTNNWPAIEEIIKDYKLGIPTGKKCVSGYCTYPEYRFDKDLVDGAIFID